MGASRYLWLLTIMVTALLALYPPAPAWGHAYLESTSPPAGETVEALPESVLLTFSERPEAAESASEVMVFGPDGSRVDRGELMVERQTVTVPLSDGEPGTYCVEWRVRSAIDNHPTSGHFTFHVGEGSELACPVPGDVRDEALPDTDAGPEPGAGEESRLPLFGGDPLSLATAVLALLLVAAAVAVFKRRR